MDIISGAGKVWLDRHGIDPTQVHKTANRPRRGALQTSKRPPIESDSPNGAKEYSSKLVLRQGCWLLVLWFGNMLYKEHLTGHATLKVFRTTLPDDVCRALHRTATPLAELVELPEQSVIHAANPKVFGASARNANLRLLLRITRERLPAQESPEPVEKVPFWRGVPRWP